MILDTEQLERTAPAETAAKPPPQAGEARGYRLFQTMDELRARHGNGDGTKRLMHDAVALIGGLLLFAALYAVILFLE